MFGKNQKWIDFRSGVRSQKNYLYELESLRGIAILLVILFHTWGICVGGAPVDHSILLSFLSSGNTGVTLFFVLSGFLLSTPFIQGLQSGTHPSITQYYFSRALRIIPLYYFVVVASILITGRLEEGLPALWFSYVGFSVFPYSVVWWTLCTEVQFYILLPALMVLIRSKGGRILLLLALVTWAYFYFRYSIENPGSLPRQYNNLMTKSIFARLPAFLFGILGAFLYQKYKHPALQLKQKPAIRSLGLILCIMFIYLLGLVLQHSSSLGNHASEKTWHIKHSYEALCWLGILLSVLMLEPFGKSLLINNINGVLGKLSYSLYLVHVPILFMILQPTLVSLGRDGFINSHYLFTLPSLAIALSIAVSFATYRLIELPFLKLKEHFPKRDRGTFLGGFFSKNKSL